MKKIIKLFKKAEINKKMVELLFEKLKEKPNIFEENMQKLKIQNNQFRQKKLSFNSLNIGKNENTRKKEKFLFDFQYIKEKDNDQHSSFALSNKEFLNKKSGIIRVLI